VDKTRAKAKAEMVQRSKARKVKQQMNVEWKVEISRKSENLSELSRLRKDIQRIVVALEKLAGIKGQDSDKELLSWLELEKGKQKKERMDEVEEEAEVGGQEEEDRMEGVEERGNSFFPVIYSVSTGAF